MYLSPSGMAWSSGSPLIISVCYLFRVRILVFSRPALAFWNCHPQCVSFISLSLHSVLGRQFFSSNCYHSHTVVGYITNMSTDYRNRLGLLRDRRPSSRLAADNNVAQPVLSSHCESIALAHTQRARAADAYDPPPSALSTSGVDSAQGQLNRDDTRPDLPAASLQPIIPTILQPDGVGPTTDSGMESERSLHAAGKRRKRKRKRKDSGMRFYPVYVLF